MVFFLGADFGAFATDFLEVVDFLEDFVAILPFWLTLK